MPFSVLGQLRPLASHSEPRRFVRFSNGVFSLTTALFGLRAEPSDVLVGHSFKIAGFGVRFKNIHLGGCEPGERSHSIICEPFAACRARRSVASRTTPCGSKPACSRRRLASSESRCSKVSVCLKSRRSNMARSFPSEEGGSAAGVLITEKSHDPNCDARTVRLKGPKRESFIHYRGRFPT
jgi:hypothetical protein